MVRAALWFRQCLVRQSRREACYHHPVTISQPSVSVGRRAAVAAAILYLAVSLLIQVEDFALFLHAPADGWRAALVFAAALPFRQFEHILFTAGLSALAIPMCRWRPGRVAYVAVFGLLLLYVVIFKEIK